MSSDPEVDELLDRVTDAGEEGSWPWQVRLDGRPPTRGEFGAVLAVLGRVPESVGRARAEENRRRG